MSSDTTGTALPVAPATPLDGTPPAEALEDSRARLRSALLGTPCTRDAITTAEAARTLAVGGEPGPATRTATSARPAAGLVANATWWQLGHEVADALLAPTARRHPVALLAGATAAGGLLAQLLVMRPMHAAHAMVPRARHHLVRRLLSVALAVTPPGTWRALARWAVRTAAHAPAQAATHGVAPMAMAAQRSSMPSAPRA